MFKSCVVWLNQRCSREYGKSQWKWSETRLDAEKKKFEIVQQRSQRSWNFFKGYHFMPILNPNMRQPFASQINAFEPCTVIRDSNAFQLASVRMHVMI